MYNETLILIEDMCLMLTNKGLIQLGMTMPNCPKHDTFNQELRCKIQYDSKVLKETVLRNVPLLNEQQKYAYDTLMKVVNDGTGGFFFLDAPGGAGKTFLISLILATIQLPLNMPINETPICNLLRNSAMVKVLQQTKFIVWDECMIGTQKIFGSIRPHVARFTKEQKPVWWCNDYIGR